MGGEVTFTRKVILDKDATCHGVSYAHNFIYFSDIPNFPSNTQSLDSILNF